MEDDLRKYLDAKFDGLRSHMDVIEARNRMANLTRDGERDVLSVLEKRIRALEDRASVLERAQEFRGDAGKLDAMARFPEFAEASEERWVALVGRVEALEKRLEGK
jgi:hypothetical protein